MFPSVRSGRPPPAQGLAAHRELPRGAAGPVKAEQGCTAAAPGSSQLPEGSVSFVINKWGRTGSWGPRPTSLKRLSPGPQVAVKRDAAPRSGPQVSDKPAVTAGPALRGLCWGPGAGLEPNREEACGPDGRAGEACALSSHTRQQLCCGATTTGDHLPPTDPKSCTHGRKPPWGRVRGGDEEWPVPHPRGTMKHQRTHRCRGCPAPWEEQESQPHPGSWGCEGNSGAGGSGRGGAPRKGPVHGLTHRGAPWARASPQTDVPAEAPVHSLSPVSPTRVPVNLAKTFRPTLMTHVNRCRSHTASPTTKCIK